MEGWNMEAIRRAFQGRRAGIYGARGVFAVLVPLVEREGELCLLFEFRSERLRGQPSETCFPGGRVEPDEEPEDAALRETFEEIGIPPAAVEPVAALDVIQDVADRVIYPFLGKVDEAAVEAMVLNPEEVAEVFFVPLSHLREVEPYVYTAPVITEIGADFPYEKIGFPKGNYRWGKGRVEVPIFEHESHHIWGLTARIVRQLLEILEESEAEGGV